MLVHAGKQRAVPLGQVTERGGRAAGQHPRDQGVEGAVGRRLPAVGKGGAVFTGSQNLQGSRPSLVLADGRRLMAGCLEPRSKDRSMQGGRLLKEVLPLLQDQWV